MQVYQYDLTHTNQLDPHNPFFAPGTSIYEVLNNGQHTNRFYYDRGDRLVGAEYSRGTSIAYTYDGNDNLVRQATLSRASETNGLPVLWRFLNGLTNNTSPYADTDGDGWTDYQEWKAGTNPRDPNSAPNLLGNPGISIASLTLPFTPSNFVVGVGQLDGLGAEEIVIGADGNPGTNTNFLLVLTQTSSGWSTQRVDVGPFGITSIAMGQPTNRPSPAIYVGLRQTGGTGRVLELMNVGGVWQTNVVAMSTNSSAFIFRVRSNYDLLGAFAGTDGGDGGLRSLAFMSNSWNSQLYETNVSHRGLGVLAEKTVRPAVFRLLDQGDIESASTLLGMMTGTIYRPESDTYYYLNTNLMTWTAAQAYASSLGGNLATIRDSSANSWIDSHFPQEAGNTNNRSPSDGHRLDSRANLIGLFKFNYGKFTRQPELIDCPDNAFFLIPLDRSHRSPLKDAQGGVP